MIIVANVGALALYLLFLWLASAIGCSYLADRKGYGERVGLASGLLLSVVGLVIWLGIPSKAGSMWRVVGPLPWQREEL